ncbi:MAG: tripartite tricarboxylate transporter TctB [Ramlibacter sp.]|nr:tripartite tricarboxylate transporter TctB [Ramlibacter sp.]
MAISLLFGLTALHYPIGDFSRGGPGLFPTIVSGLLFIIGLATAIRARFVDRVPLDINPRNISIVLGSLVGFAVISRLNMMVGIIVLVFVATAAGTSYSWVRNVKISFVLILIALAFQRFLGVNLPLY